MQKGAQCQHGLQKVRAGKLLRVHMSIALAAADGPIGGLCGCELQVHTMSFAANIWFWGAWSLQDHRGLRGKFPWGPGLHGGSVWCLLHISSHRRQKSESGGHVMGLHRMC